MFLKNQDKQDSLSLTKTGFEISDMNKLREAILLEM